MKNQIKLNSEISINLQRLVESRLLIQANSGGGKSWLIRRILEQSHGKIQQIVIDLEGEFHTLREKFDYLLVAKGGDVPAHIKTADILAQGILKLNVSAIIDLYELSAQDRKHYARLFLESMINSPKELWHNCLVIVDEAHVFCPEKGQSEAAEAVNSLATRGRKRGFCAILATQRISKLHKDAAAECNNKLIGRCGLDIDMKRGADELGFTAKDRMYSLRQLKPGEFFAFGPAISDQVQQIKVGDVQTSHPKIGSRSFMEVAPPTEKIKQALKKLIELPQIAEKKLATEKEFREEITRLKRELSVVRSNRKTEHIPDMQKMVDRQVRQAVASANREFELSSKSLLVQLRKYEKILSQIGGLLGLEYKIEKTAIPVKVQSPEVLLPGNMPDRDTSIPRKLRPSSGYSQAKAGMGTGEDLVVDQNHHLGTGERKILIAIAQNEEGISREHLTVLTGYKSSSRNTYIQRLRQSGLVALAGENIIVTQEGIERLGNDYESLPVGLELQNYWMQHLPEGEKKILRILIEAYPDPVNREVLSEQAEYAPSSRNTYLQRLKSRQLVKFEGPGMVRATEKLFD